MDRPGLEKDYFRKYGPATLIAKINELTLPYISTWNQEYLEYVGWLNNPIIETLYSMTSAGAWVAKRSSAGYELPLDSISTATACDNIANALFNAPPHVNALADQYLTAAAGIAGQRRTKILTHTCDGSGVAAAQAVFTPTSGYYPVVRLKHIISTVTEATALMNITVTGGALVGPAQISFSLGAGIINTQALDLLLYNLTDDATINIAWDSAGAAAVIRTQVEYWGET